MCRLLPRASALVAALSLGCTTTSSGDSDAGNSTGPDGINDTGTPSDTSPVSIPCPSIDPHIKHHVDSDGLVDTVLESQDDVAILAGCTDISGSLRISGSVTDLTPLASLRRIVGSLSIYNSGGDPDAPLLSLAGLEGLESVRGITLQGLGVTSLEPLAGLTQLPDGLELVWLSALESLAGLHNLQQVGGPITIIDAAKLTDIQALAGLTQIPDTLELSGLRALESLEGLHNLEHVGGPLTLANCKQLKDLVGLRSLRRIDTSLSLENLEISSLHGLEALTEVGVPGGERTGVALFFLPQLTSLDPLAVDWHPANGVLIYQTLISDLETFAGVTELRTLTLIENDKLVDLAGLESLTFVHDTLALHKNRTLVDIGALANLQTVGTMTLKSSELTDLALPALQQIGELRVSSNAQLAALSGLDGLTSLGSLVLEFNPALTALPELSALAQVEGDLEIRGNDALATVADLAAVTSVGGRLVVVVNRELLQTEAVAWGEPISVGVGRKIAGNKGDVAPLADPCPWENDGECDQEGGNGIGVCAAGTDERDCVIGE